jgi:hypothetical protein
MGLCWQNATGNSCPNLLTNAPAVRNRDANAGATLCENASSPCSCAVLAGMAWVDLFENYCGPWGGAGKTSGGIIAQICSPLLLPGVPVFQRIVYPQGKRHKLVGDMAFRWAAAAEAPRTPYSWLSSSCFGPIGETMATGRGSLRLRVQIPLLLSGEEDFPQCGRPRFAGGGKRSMPAHHACPRHGLG